METQARIFTPTAQQRLGLQNRVLRELRAAGCRVTRAALDAHLTLEIAPPVAPLGGARVFERLDGNCQRVSLTLHGCTVRWIEVTTPTLTAFAAPQGGAPALGRSDDGRAR